MIGNSISVSHVETNSYQSQLIIRQVMTQDCVKDCVPIIIPKLLKIYHVPMVGLIALEHIPNVDQWPMGRSGFILLL